jgi:hydroxypyruvate reductase
VVAALEAGALETPKPGDAVFRGHGVQLVATPGHSLEAAADAARAAGLEAYVLGDDLEGESREVAKVHAALARAVARRGQPFKRPCVILSGGETTVSLRAQPHGTPRGRGGRAGEFCLGLAQALQAQPGVHALAADTDGIDGVEDNAGAYVGPDTLQRARGLGLSKDRYGIRPSLYRGSWYSAKAEKHRICIAKRESHGNYKARSSGGVYQGAYQMNRGLARGATWMMQPAVRKQFGDEGVRLGQQAG